MDSFRIGRLFINHQNFFKCEPEKNENTQENTSSPLNIEPEIIQRFYDNLSEFFEISPVDNAVRFLNELYCSKAYYEYKEEKEDESPETNVLVKNVKAPRLMTITDYKREINFLNSQLEDAGIFTWKSSRFIELIIDLNELLVELTEAGMTPSATKSLMAKGLSVKSPKPAAS